MRSLVYGYNVSLDGYIEDKSGSIGWTEPDEELHRYFNDLEHGLDTHLYGRRLWEMMSEFWPTADQDPEQPDVVHEYAVFWQRQKKVIVSTTLKEVEGARVVRDNLAEEVRALKQEPGKNISLGGATLAQSLMGLGLVDEILCFVHPILLGGGKRMFGDLATPQHLKLVEVRHFNSGVVLLHYRKDEHAGA